MDEEEEMVDKVREESRERKDEEEPVEEERDGGMRGVAKWVVCWYRKGRNT